MTEKEQSLADDKMRAEIAKMAAEIAELRARTVKQMRESVYSPLVAGAGAAAALMAATAAIVKLFF